MEIKKALRNKVIFDMALNILATAIPTITLQLLILPLLGRRMESNNYGLLVTILAVLNVVPSTFGNTLNNIRLIYDSMYKEEGLEGDFNILLLLMSALNCIIMGLMSYYYDKMIKPVSLVLIIVVSIIWLLKEYYIVAFRLDINYKAILVNNIYQVIGYFIGYGLYLVCGYWELIYFIGYMCGLTYIILHSEVWKEPVKITPFFSRVSFQCVLLLIAGLLTRITVYADKMLIYPLLGGTIVSIYYVATVFGKLVALLVTPVTSVLLTYIAKNKKRESRTFIKTLTVGSVVCFIGYILCVIFSKPILGFLYPQYIEDACKYIYITSATTVIYALISIINPFILRYFNMWWQIAINGLTVMAYVFLAITLMHFYGLMGFCIGGLVSNVLKLFFSISIFYKAKPE